MLKFQTDPRSPGINYETIRGAQDKNLRSVRIDQGYRGIIFRATRDNVFVWLHIDKHDDAYAWATKRKLSVNPVNGALGLTNVGFVEATLQRAATHGQGGILVAGLLRLLDRQLHGLAVVVRQGLDQAVVALFEAEMLGTREQIFAQQAAIGAELAQPARAPAQVLLTELVERKWRHVATF